MRWDSKFLPNIVGEVQKVDRVAVLVSEDWLEKLLTGPKMKRDMGKEQSDACSKVIKVW